MMMKALRIMLCLLFLSSYVPLIGASEIQAAAAPVTSLVNDNFEGSTLGVLPVGYTPPFGSGVITSFTAMNNSTVINSSNLRNSYGQTSTTLVGNTTNVFWISDGAGRGGFNKAFTPVTAEIGKGMTAQLDFMEGAMVSDSYVLELLDSNKKIALSLKADYAFPDPLTGGTQKFQAKTWYTVKYVADVKANTADLYINGIFSGNFKFASPVTDIASINFRMAGTSTGNAYVDNIIVSQQEAVTPQNLTTEGANRRVELSWDATSGTDTYNVYRSESRDGIYEKLAEGVPSNSYTDTAGLTNDKYYYYKVTSVNSSGESEYSYYASGYPNNVEPPSDEITGLNGIVRNGQLTVAWNPVNKAAFYTLERSTTPEGPFVPLLTNGKPKLTSTSYLDTNLRSDTAYYYRLSAGNVGGLGQPKLLGKVSPAAPLGAPTLLSIEPGNNQVQLNWTSVTKASSYSVKRSLVNGGPYIALTNVIGTGYLDTTAENGKTYYYVVDAVNDGQESMISNQLKAKPYAPVNGAPAKPTSFQAVANEGSVSLSWNAVIGASSYNVKRAISADGPYTVISSTYDAIFGDLSVTNGITYYYVVSAVNSNGESPDTDELVVLPAAVLTVDKNVTADGVKVFNTIQSAINQVPTNNTTRTIIHIASGTYTEKVKVDRPYVSLVGAGMDKTTIMFGDYAGTAATQGKPGHTGNTFLSQTVDVTADFFNASNLTIENSAGPRNEVAQAVALSLKSDMAVLESVRLKGFQDTLYNGLNTKSQGRHYFHNSIIEGDVDFIFGEAPAVVMDNVKLVLVSNVPTGASAGGHITAGAQKNTTDKGYLFINSQVVDGPSAQGIYDLGRAWKDYARVTFINTFIDSKKFLPEGWAASCAGSCITSYFSEYNSYGYGANATARQISTQLTGQEASLTISQILGGWDPSIPVIMPKVNYAPAVVVTSSNFDKNPANQADINVSVRTNGFALTNITNGTGVLESLDYTVTGSVYTLKKDYLSRLPVGSTTLGFNFGDIAVPLIVNVVDSEEKDIGRQVLMPNDGWGAHTTGTTGGSTANPEQIFIVSKRSELVKALAGGTMPKMIYINGTIDMNVDQNDNPIGMEFYKDPLYDFNAYLQTYDPAVWGKTLPGGALEEARVRSASNQSKQIKVNVGSNTTIVGLPGTNAKILGGNLNVENVDNVIIRNIEFRNTFDYFPQWDPTDGDLGNWNSAYDSISVKSSTHVWIDHNTFSDIGGMDDPNHTYFGRKYQQHDGAVDMTNASDFITVSYNYFHDHDKTTLVGGSDSFSSDAGKERITFHHNFYRNVGQRAPRVRYGQVHVYNNYYEGTVNHPNNPFLYAIGVGYQSQVYAENNYFANDAALSPSSLIQVSSGTAFTDKGSVLNGENVEVAKNNGTLQPVNWTPRLYTFADQTAYVPALVIHQAGAENTQTGDTSAPLWNSGNLTATNVTKTGLTLNWHAAVDNIGVTGYRVYLVSDTSAKEIAVLDNVTTYNVANLQKDTNYKLMVKAVDASGNLSLSGPSVTIKTDHDNRDNNPGDPKKGS
ncbi:pectinesterase family protein [Paenibacillus sp. LjRoot153]|uniref:pectinesterase family protein n=1 Tax=Paenibacillus sp. LjRoot153 TaxID=3342270 RepID=UPI003ECF6CD7